MAKQSKINRNNLVLKKAKALQVKRSSFVEKMKSASSLEEFLQATQYLIKTSRWNINRYRNRCGITGRPRGFYGLFGLSRNVLREEVSKGNINGLRKTH